MQYKTIKLLADFISPDKNLQSLTPELVALLRKPSIATGIIFLFISVYIFLRPRKTRDFIETILQPLLQIGSRFFRDSRIFFRDFWNARPVRLEIIILAVIILFSAVARLMIINRPIEYDEAFTFVEFARNPFRYILTSYYVPNNHVFHTILVRISYLLFGNHLWAIRLPSFIASLFLVLSVYFLGRTLYNNKVGLTASVIIAFLPVMILRSVSARGYIIVTLASISGFLAADYVIRKKNTFAWFVLAGICAIGFYTVPVMLFPCGLLFVWLFITGLTKATGQEYTKTGNWLKYLIPAGFLVVILSLLFYSPILLTNNLRQIYEANRVLQPARFNDFIASLPATFSDMFMEWSKLVAGPILYVLFAGLLLSFVFHKKYSKYRIPLQLIFIVYIVIMALIERPYSISRVWLWVIPFLALWCAAGVVGGLEWLTQRLPIRTISSLVLGLLLFGFAVNGMYQSYDMAILHPIAEDPSAQKLTQYLKPIVNNDNLVVVSGCSNARYWYYFQLYGIPERMIRDRNRYFDKLYIIVYTQANPSCGAEEMSNVFSENGPDAVFFDISTARIIKQIDYATIYELDPIPEKIQKAYPSH
jgi:uncharacterized membrane protein